MKSMSRSNAPSLLRVARAVAGPSGRDYTATTILGGLLVLAVGLMARLDYLQARWQLGLQQDAAVVAALNETGTGTLVLDATGQIVASNKAARGLLGIASDASHNIHDFHKIEARPKITALLNDSLRVARETQHGQKYQLDCIIPVPVDGGPRVPRPFQILIRVAPQPYSEPHIVAFVSQREPIKTLTPQSAAK